jgi:hypothetical protein
MFLPRLQSKSTDGQKLTATVALQTHSKTRLGVTFLLGKSGAGGEN